MAVPVPGRGQARVKTLACGICGSDLHMVRHGVHPAWREAMKSFFEGRPFGLHHGMFQPGAEDAQGHGGNIAVIAYRAQVRIGLRLRQLFLHCRQTAIARGGCFVNFLECCHGKSLA